MKISGFNNFSLHGSIFIVFLCMLFFLSKYPYIGIVIITVYLFYLKYDIQYIKFENDFMILKYYFKKETQIAYSNVEKITFDYDKKFSYLSEHFLCINLINCEKNIKIGLQQEIEEYVIIGELLKNQNLKHKIVIKGSDELKKRIKEG